VRLTVHLVVAQQLFALLCLLSVFVSLRVLCG
jgi:hypothetical protein